MRAEGCALTSALTLNAQFLLQKRRSSFGNISMVFESYFREGCLKAINLGLMRTLQVPFMDNWQAHSEALYLFILEAPLLLRTHQLTGFWTGLMAANMLAAAQLAPCFTEGQPWCTSTGHIHGDFGRDENHFNVAAAGQRRAIVIDLPSLDHQVLQAD